MERRLLQSNREVGDTMQGRSQLWDAYYYGINKTIEYKVVIGAEEYHNADLYSIAVSGGLCPEDVFSIGNVMCRKLDVTIKPKATPIPKMANVDLYMRYNGDSGPTEWLPKGKHLIDTRQKTNGRLRLECYDKALMMEKPFIQTEEVPDFPMPMLDAMGIICNRLNLTFENPEGISGVIEYPNELTMREVAGYIASANGGNFVLTDEGKLRLVIPGKGDWVPGGDSITWEDAGIAWEDAEMTWAAVEGISYAAIDEINDTWTVSRVTLYYDEEHYFTAGDDTADELIINNPWATQAMTNRVMELLRGYQHTPYTATGVYINPAAEIGDTLMLGEHTGIICTANVRYGPGVVWDIGSPGDTALEHEYPYEGSYSRAIRQRVALNHAYYGVTIDRANGLKVEKSDGSSQAVFNSDKIALQVGGVDKVYFDAVAGKYKFVGDIIMEGGSISWNSINAPTAEDVGAKPYDWQPSISDVSGLSSRLTYIDGQGIYTGTLTAQQINAIQGITLGANASINWTAMNKPSASQVGALATSWVGTTYINAYGLYTGQISASQINTGVLNAALINVINLRAESITGGLLSNVEVQATYLQVNEASVNQQLTVAGMLSAFEVSSTYGMFISSVSGNIGAVNSRINLGGGGCQIDYSGGYFRAKSASGAYLLISNDGMAYYDSFGQRKTVVLA